MGPLASRSSDLCGLWTIHAEEPISGPAAGFVSSHSRPASLLRASPGFASSRHNFTLRGMIVAMRIIEARYEEGLLKPETPLALTPGERVALIVVRHPDPRRWNLQRLATSGEREDRALAEQGLAEWADTLDREDHS
jgi:predicted DNA-binding antitoxin AbrB/MazE fold protein